MKLVAAAVVCTAAVLPQGLELELQAALAAVCNMKQLVAAVAVEDTWMSQPREFGRVALEPAGIPTYQGRLGFHIQERLALQLVEELVGMPWLEDSPAGELGLALQ